MGNQGKRIDACIPKSAAFAQPVLAHLRSVVHQACPGVGETIKRGFPHFEYNGILCSMASFKRHCTFGFWKASLMSDPQKILAPVGETAMGQFGKLRALADLPPDRILKSYIKEAARLNQEGIKLPRRTLPAGGKRLIVPGYFKKALEKNKKAMKAFEQFSLTNKREYVDWVTEAKGEETRVKRLNTSVKWLSEGKMRNWKYV